jgi:LPPG:FO 2-phospho-L-lactate transferase
MLDVVGAEDLVVVANTADDIEIYGAYVSPDPDLITLWLADRIDARGWGIDGDTFNVMDALKSMGEDIWFNLGDADLALGIKRADALSRGATLTEAHTHVAAALGVQVRVLPMSDTPVRTRVLAQQRWWPFQEFMIRGRGEGPVRDVEFRGDHSAAPTRDVLEAITTARAIVIGPSNPVISIGPILAVDGMVEALRSSTAPVVAVSPLVKGRVVKGPTRQFMEWSGEPVNSTGIAHTYSGVIEGLIADERTDLVPVLLTDVMMDTPENRARVASETLRFALSLS